MNKNNVIIGLIAVAALVIGVVAYNKQAEPILGATGSMGPQGVKGDVGPMGPQGPMGPAGKSATLGAISSPDLPYNYIGVGGVRYYSYSRDYTVSTTTVCAIQGPAATSTLTHAGALFTTASTTASIVTLARAATAFATTTSIGSIAIAANGTALAVGSTTPAVAFGPNQWFVVGMQGGTGTFSPVGQCYAQFIAIE